MKANKQWIVTLIYAITSMLIALMQFFIFHKTGLGVIYTVLAVIFLGISLFQKKGKFD
ncbi:MAG: hypothetical protein IIZ18_01520 [Ruminococcus sp.]|nr:hypothetical protein [Ruminococcus sp.]